MPVTPISLNQCLPRIADSYVLVTGGAGFIGSHLVDFLLRHSVQNIVIVDNLIRSRHDWLVDRIRDSKIQFFDADILDAHTLSKAIANINVIFHLAAVATVMNAAQDPERTFAVNTMGTVRLALAAQQAHVRRFVFTSSREVYGDPLRLPVAEDSMLKPKNVYGASKAAAECFLGTLDRQVIEPVILRLANVYGPADSDRVIPTFIDNAMRKMPITLYGGQQLLDLIWIEDVVESLVKAGFSEQPILEPTNIGSGKTTGLHELARRILALTGSDVPILTAPPRGPDVENYQADLRWATQRYGLLPKTDPLDHLSETIAAARGELARLPTH